MTTEPTAARAPAREALIADRLHEAGYTAHDWPPDKKGLSQRLTPNLWCYALDLESREPLWPEPLGLWRRDAWNRNGVRVVPQAGLLEALTGEGPTAAKELAGGFLERARAYGGNWPVWFPAEGDE